jgi:hypothetical protein
MRNRQNKFAAMRTFNTFGATVIYAAIFCFLCLLQGVGVHAQTSQGFTGLVTDSTGAVIPKATVTVHNQATAVDKSVITTSTGNWTVPFLDPGIYDVRVEANKFKSIDKTNITLSTGETAEVNFTLVPGAATETVTVNASEDVLDYDKADVGNVLENHLLQQLPDFDNDTFNFAIFTPGMMTTTTGLAPGNQSAQTFTIHGASVEFSIDGVANISETGPEHYTMAPPSDSLQEFKITTSPVDAANGRAPSGQIDMTLKTGTKSLHGAAYEYLQRAFLNANTPQNDANIFKNVAAGAPAATIAKYNKAAFTQNQYGFELDGPVIVSKFWSGKKQTFFMILYEDLHTQGIGTVITTVPNSSAMANGDFSSLLNVGGVPGVTGVYNEAIYDPTSEAACTANNTDNSTYASGHPAVCRYQYGYGPGTGAGPQGNPVLIGTPNVIPANKINAVAQNIMSWYPAPNQSPTPTTANPFNNNYVGLAPAISDNKSYIVKLDQYVGKNDTFDVTGKLWKFYGQNNNAFPRSNVNAAHPGLNEAEDIAHYNGTDYRYPSLNASWTHTFSPTLINAFRGLVTTALESDSTGPASGWDPSQLGFSSSIGAANPTYFQRFPLTNISNYNALGAQAVLYRGDDELQLIDTANWTRGNHVMHFGGEVRFQQYSQKSTNGTGFSLSTDDGWTQQWDTNVTGGKNGGVESQYPITNNYSGNSLASMEAGTWSPTGTVTATTAGGNYVSSHYGALYFQDDWKYRPKLTLNLGVRWEDPGRGVRDRFNRLNSVWDFNDQNPVTSLIPAATLAGLPVPNGFVGGPTYAGINGNPTWQFKRVWYEFGPRAGFAYTWNQKTVIRGGMGLFFNDTAAGNLNSPSNIGYSTSNTYTPSSSVAQGTNTLMVPQLNLANPFPTFQAATGNCGGNWQQCLESNLGQASTFYNPKFHPAAQLNTSFGVERQLTTKDTIEVNYAGTRLYGPLYGVTDTDDMNHVSASAQAACDPLRGGLQSNCTAAADQITNPFKGVAPFAGSSYYTATTIGKLQFSRPYPQFLAITEAGLQNGKSWYNGLEAVYTHRTSWGLTANVGYTKSKFIVNTGFADVVNRIPSRVLSGTDVPNRLTALIVYKLPIARGSGFFPNMPRVLDLVVGGWQTADSYEYQSGFPQALTSGWIVNQKANGGNLLPKTRYWPGNSNPWYPTLQAAGSDNYIQRLRPCVATVDPVTGGYDWINQSVPLVTAGLCTTPNYISINTTYQANPNVEYTGAREGPNDQLNANVSKNFALVREMSFQMRIDAFNVFNHLQTFASGYDTSTSDGTFGIVRLGTSGNGNQTNRTIQISGRLTW